jgi:hypothetical protein
MISTPNRALPEPEYLRFLRAAAAIAVAAGACGSLGLMLYAGRRQQSRILVLLFVGWVLSPFAAAVFASVLSRRWSVITRATLSVVMLVFAIGSLAIYGAVAFGHVNVKVGTAFLVVPFASWLLMGSVPLAALVSGWLSREVA